MSSNRFIPDPEEQVDEILDLLEEHGADVPRDLIDRDELIEVIDPDKPVSLNLRPVAEVIGAVRPD